MSMDTAAYQGRQREADFMAAVRQYAELRGWLVLHIPNAVCNPPGIPDLFLWRNETHLVAELKVKGGQLGPRQKEWCQRLWDAGFPVHIWYPSDWSEIEATLR